MTHPSYLADRIEAALVAPAGTNSSIDFSPADWHMVVAGLRALAIVQPADEAVCALQNIGDYMAYSMAKAKGAQLTDEDLQTIAVLMSQAGFSLGAYRKVRAACQK